MGVPDFNAYRWALACLTGVLCICVISIVSVVRADDGDAASTVPVEASANAADGSEAVKSSASSSEDVVTDARAHFTAGQKAFKAKDFETAVVEFEAANALKPHPSALKMVAECKLKLGEIAAGVTLLEQLLKEEAYGKKAELKKRLATERKKIGQMSFRTKPEGVTVRIDDVEQSEKTPTERYVEPGMHEVIFMREGYGEQYRSIEVAAGDEIEVSLDYTDIEPLPPVEPEPALEDEPQQDDIAAPDALRVAPVPVELESDEDTDEVPMQLNTTSEELPQTFWAASAVAGIGLVSGTVFGTMALRDEKDFEQTADEATRDSGKRAALVADISFGIALGAAVAGAIVLISHKKKKSAQSSMPKTDNQAKVFVLPAASPEGLGLATAVSF